MTTVPDFTVVLGLDETHLEQLHITWPTWQRHKPSLLQRPFLVFYDSENLDVYDRENIESEIDELIGNDVRSRKFYPWPDREIDYGQGQTKWDNPQRHKMLAGFLHVSVQHVSTPYFLKLDTDAIATGMDNWVDPHWFSDEPAIVAPPFGYTKPPGQMLALDQWAKNAGLFPETPPLELVPEPTASLLRHPRICGWCDFFHMGFLRECAAAALTAGPCKLPEPSLDGFTWYVAQRTQRIVRTVKMKSRGWDVRHSFASIREAAAKALS